MGIKNFKAPKKAIDKNENRAILVSDFMTKKLITFSEDQTLLSVIDTLISNKISGGPVVNKKGDLVGIISEGDCIKQISESRYYNMPISDKKVSTYMIKNVETIDGNMDIFDAANKFLKSKRRRFPIMKNGNLIGQISQKDILKAALDHKGHDW
ncbi:MAG: inosine-5-monophosphate dehydrogenase [Bacteroidetes bacterium MedPE-SWsnd-G1]|nr:MAG: inosine-5-monophosphate dehydrogenase [Bacteroidetes bacterium MedPE-SWsnd-G1]